MKTLSARLSICLVLLAMMVALVPGVSGDAPAAGPLVIDPGRGLFGDSPVAGDLPAAAAAPTVTRSRAVDVRFEALGDFEHPAQTVVLNLFDDASFTAVFERTETNALGSFGWIGRLEGVEYGQAILVVTHGLLAGTISMPGAVYEVRPLGTGLHAIEQIDQAAFPAEMAPIEAPSIGTRDLPQALLDDCDEITVLVAYSPEAAAADGGTAAIEARIATAVAETNQSYINSGLVQRLTLAHAIQTSPGDAKNNFSTDLYALQDTTDGVFDNVDAARETYYADEVALIIENSASCGLGFVNSTAAWAFVTVHRTCATGYFSFGHELGHNMGARHDWFVDATTSPGYEKGFARPASGWRTIMAYNDWCDCTNESDPCPASSSRTSPSSPYCTRLQYWSNPDITYGGNAMGVPIGSPLTCTTYTFTPDPSICAADNRTRLNNTCSTVANFRVSPTAVTLDRFQAAPQDGAILLSWETASELETLGFHVYRADQPGGVQTRLNEELIPAQAAGSPLGAAYTFLDQTAEAGIPYYYWLEDVSADGASTLHGPVSATAIPVRRMLPTRPRLGPGPTFSHQTLIFP